MGGNNSKRGSYDLEKSAKKATSKKLKTEKAISFINLTEQEIYEDLFPFRRRSTRRRRNVQDEDPRPYSVAVMEDNCYNDSVLPLRRTSLGSDGENLKSLERRDTKSEPILYNEADVEEDLPDDVPQVPPRGIIVNQNEGYVYSVEDFPQQYQYSLHTRFMDIPNEPSRTFISDSTSTEERQYHSIQENSRKILNESTFQPRRASCPEIILETVENSYFPNITEYYFQTISQRELHENQKVQKKLSGSSSTSSGMSEVERGQTFISSVSNDNSLRKFDATLNENEIDPCCIYDTITSSNILQPYEIQLINDWLSKAQADCYINREGRKKLSPLHNEEDFFTAASDSLPSCTGSRLNKVTFDETVTKRVYSASSETDEGDRIKGNPAVVPRRNSDTSSLTSSGSGSVKFSSGYRYRDEKGTIYSEDGYKSSEENTEDSDEDEIKMRKNQMKLLMSNPIISAESIEQLRSNYHARMNEQNDLHVISETEEEEDENFYDALDQERNKELIEFIEQYPSLNGLSDENYFDKLNVNNQDNDYLDADVQSSFAKFESLCQTEKLRFDVQCERDENNPIEEMQKMYPILIRDLDDFSLSSETIVSDNNLLELGRQEEHTSKMSRHNGEEQNEGPQFSNSSDDSNQKTGIHFPIHSKADEKFKPVYHIPNESKVISKTNESKANSLEKENINFDPINTKKTECEIDKKYLQRQEEEHLYDNYEYINSLMKKSNRNKEVPSPNYFNDSDLQEGNDKLLSTGENDVTESGQMLHCKQVKVEETYEPEILKNDNIVYAIPDESHTLEEIVQYNSENFDFEQNIKYEFIHNQQLIYPVKIKDDLVNNESSNTKYKVTSYDPNITTDDMEILKPFDKKSIGLLPDEVDLQLRTSEEFGTITTLDEKNEQKQGMSNNPIMEANDGEHLQYLKNVPLRSLTNTANEEELQFYHTEFTNPFLNGQMTIENQMKKESIDDVQQSSVIAPKPKPRKNPPKSNNPKMIINDGLQSVRSSSENNFDGMESNSATVGSESNFSQNISNGADFSGLIIIDNDPNDSVSQFSHTLNTDNFRNQLTFQLESEKNMWIDNDDTNLDEAQEIENIVLKSNDASRIIDNREDTLSKGESTKSGIQGELSSICFGDLDVDIKSKVDILIDDQENTVNDVLQESQTLLDETTFAERPNKNEQQEEDLSIIQENKQKETDLVQNICLRDNDEDYTMETKKTEFKHMSSSNYPFETTQLGLKETVLQKETYDDGDKMQRQLRNQSSIKGDASENVEMYDSIEFRFQDTLEIQSDNSLDCKNNAIFLDYLKNEVMTDRFDKIEQPHIDTHGEDNIDNVNIYSIQESEWFLDESNEHHSKPLEIYCQSQKLPTVTNINTSVIYYEQFKFPIITETRDEEKEGTIILRNENTELMNNKSQEAVLRNSSVLHAIMKDEGADSDNMQSNVYTDHILKNQDQDPLRLNLYSSQIPVECSPKGNSELQHDIAVKYSENFPIYVTLDSSRASVNTFEDEIVKGDDVVENINQRIEKIHQHNSENFNDPNELRLNKENIEHHISLPKRNLPREINDLVSKSFQNEVPDKTFLDFSKTNDQEISENLSDLNNHDRICSEYSTETKSPQDIRLEDEVTDKDFDIFKLSLNKYSTSEVDDVQQKHLHSPSTPGISDTSETQKHLNYLCPVEILESFGHSKEEATDEDINISKSTLIKFPTNEVDELQENVLDSCSTPSISEIGKTQNHLNNLSPVQILDSFWRSENKATGNDIDISKSLLIQFSHDVDEMQQNVLDSFSTLSATSVGKTQEYQNYSNPVEIAESFKDEKRPFALRNNYTSTQLIKGQPDRSEVSPTEENQSESFHYSIHNPYSDNNLTTKGDSLVDQNLNKSIKISNIGDRKEDTPECINRNKDSAIPRKTLSQIFRNRQQHDRPKSVTDLIRKVEFNSPIRRTISNPEKISETPSNSNNQTSETYLKCLFSKISNTKTFNTFENSSTDVTKVSKSNPYISKSGDAISRPDNFTNAKVEQPVLDKSLESVRYEAIDNPPQRTSIKKNTVSFDNFRENSVVKEESDEELELEKIFQDLDFISERIKSSDENHNNVNIDDLYIELLKIRVTVHKIQNGKFNYNLMTMRKEALKKVRSLLKDIDNAKHR